MPIEPSDKPQYCNQWERGQVPCLSCQRPHWLPAVPIKGRGWEQADMSADVTVTWILVWSCSEAERQSCAGQLLLRQQWRALRW